MISVDWTRLRTLNGSQQAAFEELCCQLAAYDIPSDAQFIRKGTPDGGVEGFAFLYDSSEWGWQAKFFNTLGAGQWTQLDQSVQTAIEKHPNLIRYTICLPFDRPDARREDHTSMLQRWNDHVAKWQGWATNKGMAIQFVYWGNHEIIDRLSREEHRGRVYFWFGQEFFSNTWFSKLVDESVVAAGPRYTPEIDVHLPIAQLFDGLGRTDEFFNRIKLNLREVKNALRRMHFRGFEQEVEQAGIALQESTQKLITEAIVIQSSPIALLPWDKITNLAARVQDAVEACDDNLQRAESESFSNKAQDNVSDNKPGEKLRSARYDVYNLSRKASEFQQLIESDEVRLSNLPALLLVGEAGKGKSHLFCDVAQRRIASGLPTILLMGQRFIYDEPWSQIIKLLRLRPDTTVDEFLGAFEACAQARGAKALIMIDALNEGEGKKIWKNNMAALLQTISRYQWISVAVSVRSSYEEVVIPKELIGTRLVNVQHHGFADHEYEAMRTFCSYYGIELPSIPLLIPEFRTPLFLKILCKGLKDSGVSKFPTGLSGVTSIFRLFINTVNDKLSAYEYLDYPKQRQIIWRVLDRLAGAMAQSQKDWLRLDDAEAIVEQVWPNQNTSKPLLRYLVEEGVLTEDQMRGERDEWYEVIRFGYERFSEHLIAKYLLDKHLDPQHPELAFADGNPLAFLNEKPWINSGLIAALCVQIPERIGRELPDIAPHLADNDAVRGGFIESLIWRDPKSISDTTKEYINRYINHSDYVLGRIFDIFLTVSVVPGHPYNADFLYKHLMKFEMAERDTWWSTFLHDQRDTHGAMNRLIDWAWSPEIKDHIDEEAIRLCGIALVWFLTTSNRFVRDRATKALVNLFTNRLRLLQALIQQFREVNDLYISERLFAIAYGCALRSLDDNAIASLAQLIYDWIFRNGHPPAHILLRDYARGVIEYALHRGLLLDVDINKVIPPYQSDWPEIPASEEVEKYKDAVTSWDSGDTRWAQDRIYFSVMADDFARYTIGTNSNDSKWLALRIEEPRWRSQDEIVKDFVESLTTIEREKWDALQVARRALDDQVSRMFAGFTDEQLRLLREVIEVTNSPKPNDEQPSEIPAPDPEEERIWHELSARIDEVTKQLLATLSKEKRAIFEKEIFPHFQNPHERHEEPRFDLELAQRWILKRVFELGWTVERFGHFDRFAIGYSGREAHKAERVGKKYQWIAYHEFLARLADNFQFREPYSHHPQQDRYIASWQIGIRDIDPSCLLRVTGRGNVWRPTESAWWFSERYSSWDTPTDDVEWMKTTSDLPNVKSLIEVTHPRDGSQWLALSGFYRWEQPTPLEEEPFNITRREIWYLMQSYLVHQSDIDELFDWAVQQNFMGRWMPESSRDLYEVFLGEFFWSPAYAYFSNLYERTVGWQGGDLEDRVPKPIMPLTEGYLKEDKGFDCSIDESYRISLPCQLMVEKMGLQWKGVEGRFFNQTGELLAFDPSVREAGPSLLLVNRKSFLKFLSDNGFAILWTILGEKQLIGGGYDYHNWKGRMELSAACRVSNDQTEVQLTSRFNSPNKG